MIVVIRAISFAILGTALAAESAPAQLKASGAFLAGYSRISEDGAPGGSLAATVNAFYHLHPAIGFGMEAGYLGFGSHPASIDDTEVASGVMLSFAGKTELSATQVTAQALVRGIQGNTRPFVTAGAGVYVLKASAKGSIRIEDQMTQRTYHQWLEESESDKKFGFNFGGGLQFFPEPGRAGYIVDARLHVVPGAWLNGASMNSFCLMAGLVF